jgi:hypothetical protein
LTNVLSFTPCKSTPAPLPIPKQQSLIDPAALPSRDVVPILFVDGERGGWTANEDLEVLGKEGGLVSVEERNGTWLKGYSGSITGGGIAKRKEEAESMSC